MTRDQELWGVALWLQKTHGEDGREHIAEQVERLAKAEDEAGIQMWLAVAERYDRLRTSTSRQ